MELLLVEKVGEREWDALVKPGRRARPGIRLELATGSPPRWSASRPTTAAGGSASASRSSPTSTASATSRCRPTSSAPTRRPTASATRPSTPAGRARSPPPPPASTSPTSCSPRSRARGAEVAAITLHVGIGTFKPVTAELVHEHRMERERYEIPPETAAAIARARAGGGRVVAVGTTVVRALEGAAARRRRAPGGRLYDGPAGRPSRRRATDLFITPGFRFQVVDALLTNFHLPRSTLLMLVSAFAGRERMLAAYREAIAEGYRFYSYGDAMFVDGRARGLAPAGPQPLAAPCSGLHPAEQAGERRSRRR